MVAMTPALRASNFPDVSPAGPGRLALSALAVSEKCRERVSPAGRLHYYQLEDSWLVDAIEDDEQADRDAKRQAGTQSHNMHYQGFFKSKKQCHVTAFNKRVKAAFPEWSFSVSAASSAHGPATHRG